MITVSRRLGALFKSRKYRQVGKLFCDPIHWHGQRGFPVWRVARNGGSFHLDTHDSVKLLTVDRSSTVSLFRLITLQSKQSVRELIGRMIWTERFTNCWR